MTCSVSPVGSLRNSVWASRPAGEVIRSSMPLMAARSPSTLKRAGVTRGAELVAIGEGELALTCTGMPPRRSRPPRIPAAHAALRPARATRGARMLLSAPSMPIRISREAGTCADLLHQQLLHRRGGARQERRQVGAIVRTRDDHCGEGHAQQPQHRWPARVPSSVRPDVHHRVIAVALAYLDLDNLCLRAVDDRCRERPPPAAARAARAAAASAPVCR